MDRQRERRSEDSLIANPHCVPLNSAQYSELCKTDRQQELANYGWQILDDRDSNRWLGEFYDWYENAVQMPARMMPSVPSQTWDIGAVYRFDAEETERLEADLTMKLLQAMRAATIDDRQWVVVDQNHPTYVLSVHAEIDRPIQNQWAVPLLPLKNPYYFIDDQFTMGILGPYLSNTMTVFGKELLSALTTDLPELFDTPVTAEFMTPLERASAVACWERLGWRRLSNTESAPALELMYENLDGYPRRPVHGQFIEYDSNEFQAIGNDVCGIRSQRISKILQSVFQSDTAWIVFEDGKPLWNFCPNCVIEPLTKAHWPIELVPRFSSLVFLSHDGTEAIIGDNKTHAMTFCGMRLDAAAVSLPG